MEGRSSKVAERKLRAVARVVTEVTPPRLVSGRDLKLARARTSAQVKACTECKLSGSLDTGQLPVPLTGAYRGACEQVSPNEGGMGGFSVVGEAPGREESEQGKPFVGRSGKLLRALVNNAGFDWSSQVARMNVVSCWPKADGRTRGPKDEEMVACRKNLTTQLEVASWPYVLLVGAHALKAFRSDLKITHAHGGVYVWLDSYVVMPIVHPAAIMRDRQGWMRKATEEDLKLWYRIVTGETTWLEGMRMSCVRCEVPAKTHDRDMVPYCEKHWKMWGEKVWVSQRKKWDNRPQTTSLFD